MLTHLAIRDFTIIHRVDIELEPGLTVLTGETGAGKSIIFDALGLALGGRASAEVVRSGAKRAEVAATFDASGTRDVEPLCEALGIADPTECILRRTVSREGRSRAWINDSPVSTRALRDLGSRLADLQGQHAHHALLRPGHQLRALDAAGARPDLTASVGEAWREHSAVESDLEAARALAGDDERERRIDYLRFQHEELTALAAEPGEAGRLGDELRRLAHAVEIRSAAEEVVALLRDGESAATPSLHRALARLAEVESRVPGSTESAREFIDTALVYVSEASAAVRELAGGVEPDPERLAAIEHRLGVLHDAGRKHRIAPDELPRRRAELHAEIEALESGEARVRELEERRARAHARYREAAERLREHRARTAARLAGEVGERMRELGIAGGEFSVSMKPTDDPRSTGLDEVEFVVRTNPGHPPAPFSRIASGGEQSRIGLGILVATRGCLPVMVFDEVDAGVGGRVADVDTDQWWAAHAERLADLGITLGCSAQPVRYCPDEPVIRAQMASFLTRAFRLGPAGSCGVCRHGRQRPCRRHQCPVQSWNHPGLFG